MKQVRVPELMDDPSLDPIEHEKALRGLTRLNAVSGPLPTFWRQIRKLADANASEQISVLDVATGGGDIPIGLALMAKGSGVNLKVFGCDISPTAVEVANRKSAARGAAVEFFVTDALQEELPQHYDVVINSLFFHHLDTERVVALLSRMRAHTSRLILINDLERSEFSFGAVWLACHLLSTSKVVQFDGPVSVRAAYTASELLEMANQAGLQGATVKRQFPCRLLLTWLEGGDSASS